MILNNSYYVDYEFYNGQSNIKDKLLLTVRIFGGDNNALDLFFAFPEFHFSKIKYDSQIYLICQDSYNPEKTCFVLEDRPYFSAVGQKYEVKPNQYIKFGNDYFLYKQDSSPGVIKIKKVTNSNDALDRQDANKSESNSRKLTPVANQIGMIAPDIEGLNILNDSLISLSKCKGKYVFIDFWSTSCGPCIMEFPNLKQVYKEFDRSKFEIIGVVDNRLSEKLIEFIKGKELPWPNICMTIGSTKASGYRINSYPTTYLIDPDGKIISTNLRGNELMNKLLSLRINKK